MSNFGSMMAQNYAILYLRICPKAFETLQSRRAQQVDKNL